MFTCPEYALASKAQIFLFSQAALFCLKVYLGLEKMGTEQRFKVRCMRPNEARRVNQLVLELQNHQKMKEVLRLPTSSETENDLTRRNDTGEWSSNNKGTFVAVAIDLDKQNLPNNEYVIGYLIYSQAYSRIHGKYIYMNSFFIREEYRRHGLGKKFMAYLRQHAIATENKHIDVPFMNNNEVGKKFYGNYGARLVNGEYLMLMKGLDD